MQRGNKELRPEKRDSNVDDRHDPRTLGIHHGDSTHNRSAASNHTAANAASQTGKRTQQIQLTLLRRFSFIVHIDRSP